MSKRTTLIIIEVDEGRSENDSLVNPARNLPPKGGIV